MALPVKPITYTAAPDIMLSAPLFPPFAQTDPYVVSFNGITWRTGGGNIIRSHRPDPKLPGLDTRHFNLILLLIDQLYRNEVSLQPSGDAQFDCDVYKLLRLLGKTKGGDQVKTIGDLIQDLRDTNMTITRNGESLQFRAITRIKTNDRTGQLVRIDLDPLFVSFLGEIRRLVGFRLDQKLAMKSKVAQALYSYLPSRAMHHRSEAAAWEITLERLMRELCLKVPPTKSERKKYFTQNSKSILSQLDHSLLHYNKQLRVTLKPTANGKDYKLCCWTEPASGGIADFPDNRSKLFSWWIDAGRSPLEFRAYAKPTALTVYEIEALERLGLDPHKDKAFYGMAKSILNGIGDSFAERIGDLKDKTMTGAVITPFPYFCQVVRNAMRPIGSQMQLGI